MTWQVLQPWLLLALLLALAVLIGLVFDRVVLGAVRGLARRSRNELDDVVVTAIHPAVGILAAILAFQVGLHLAGEHLPAGIRYWWTRLLVAGGILLAAVMGARLVAGLLRHGARRQPRFFSVARVGSRVLAVAVYVVAFLIVLDTYGISITPLLTSLGIAGLAVALALQDTLSNFFAGVWMQTGRAVLPGHYVRLHTENLEGRILEVGWRTTKIQQLSNVTIVIPNAKLAQAIVLDYDVPDPSTGSSLTVVVDPGTDVDAALAAMLEETRAAAGQLEGLLADDPLASVSGTTDAGGIQLRLGFRIQDFSGQGRIQDELRLRILRRFRKDGIRLFALRTLDASPQR